MFSKKFLGLLLYFLLAPVLALAQSTPNLTYGQVPTAGQWNSYFAAKQDVLGYTPLNQAGGAMTGPLKTTASTTSFAGFTIFPGVAPGTPNNGDMWLTSTGLYYRANSTTYGPIIGGGIVGPVSSVIGDIAVYSNTTGNALSDSGKLLPTGSIVGTTDAQTLSNKTLTAPVIGAATGTSLNLSGLTASNALATDSSKNLVSVANTGTGNNVLATSPTLVTPVLGAATGTSLNLSGLTASSSVATDASKNLVSVANTGSGNHVLATSPTLVTPALGTPSAVVLTSGTGLPVSTGITGLGTGVATALGTAANATGGFFTALGSCTTYTPTVTFNGGTGTGSSGVGGASCTYGKLLTFRVFGLITYTTPPTNVSFSLPGGVLGVTAQSQVFPGFNSSNSSLQEAVVFANVGIVTIASPTGSTPLTASGQVLSANGTVEIQ